MQSLKKIFSLNDIQEKQVILFVDKENHKIRGIDRVVSINRNTNEYFYNPLSKPHDFSLPYQTFTGNLVKNLNNYDAYLVDESFSLKYCDQEFHSAILSWDYSYVMTFLFGNIGSLLWDLMLSKVNESISMRIKFIDLTIKHKDTLHLLIFSDTQNQVSQDSINQLKADISAIKI